MRRVHTVAQLISLAILAVLASCGNATPPGSVEILHRGLSGEPSTLDPASVTDTFSGEVLRDLYEGLTAESSAGAVIPGVAASWDIDPRGTQYTFHLRPEAKWSNGAPVTAQQFVAAWQRVVDPKEHAADADLLRIIAGAAAIIGGKAPASSLRAEALNEATLKVTLEQPAPYFPGLLNHAAAYPVYSSTTAHSHDAEHWVSNGAYLLKAWQAGTAIKLIRNPKFRDREHVAIAEVEYHFSPDDTAQLRRYRAGELDVTDNIPANEIVNLRREHPQEVRIAPLLGTAYYGINLTAGFLASNVKLRQALAMAIDRKRLVRELAQGQAAAYGFVAPGTWNYSPQSWDWRELQDAERIAKARALYAQAGFSDSTPLKIRVLYNTNPAIKNTAVVIAAMWHEVLGIQTELDDEEYRVFLQTRHAKSQWQIARLAWAADYDDAGNFLDTLRGASANNDESFGNAQYDALLDEAAQSSDPNLRREKLEAAERLMLGDYPIIPLFHFVSKRLVKPYVLGAASNPLNHLDSKWLSIAPH